MLRSPYLTLRNNILNHLNVFIVICLVVCLYEFASFRTDSIASAINSKIYERSVNTFPVKVLPSKVSDVMKTYSTSDFNYTSKAGAIKYILFWNEAYGSKDYGIGFGSEGFHRIKCPIADCFATDNRTLLGSADEFDAIVFHLRTFNVGDLPPERSTKQRWIFWSLESPQYNMQDIYPLNGLFNWTMTYRLSSDIVQPYGWLEPLFRLEYLPSSFTVAFNASPPVSTRKKLVAWFVSNCESKSRREKYVQVLARHVNVDIYGGCGHLRCSKHNVDDCYRMLEQNYKFYLSFENSYCDDYVTEKFFSILRFNVVPIVFGGADYSAIAPPYSYIDASRFKTARHLAEYLKILDNNDQFYNQYFWWKPYYRVRNRAQDLRLSMCGLCSRLHLDRSPKVYEDMEKWWIQDSHCFVPRKDNVFRVPYWID